MGEWVGVMALRLFPDCHLSDQLFPDHPFPDLHADIHFTFISLNLYEMVGECVGWGTLQLYELVGILVMVEEHIYLCYGLY